VSTLAAILADAIDKWNENGSRALDFVRNIGFPLAVAVVAMIAYAKSKTFTAVIVVVVLGAIAWVPINNPGVLGEIADMVF
jgi:hypothetical protein